MFNSTLFCSQSVMTVERFSLLKVNKGLNRLGTRIVDKDHEETFWCQRQCLFKEHNSRFFILHSSAESTDTELILDWQIILGGQELNPGLFSSELTLLTSHRRDYFLFHLVGKMKSNEK